MNLFARAMLRAAVWAGAHPRDPALAIMFGSGNMSVAGEAVTTASALQLSAVFACVRVLAETVSSVPLQLYRRLDNGGKALATDHPLYTVLHRAPNGWQTSFEWRETATAHIALRGATYSRILPMRRRKIALETMHPDRVRPFRRDDGAIAYVYTPEKGPQQTLLQEEVLRVPFMLIDGVKPVTPIEAQRETIGGAIATEKYGRRFLANDAKPSNWLEVPGKFKDDQAAKDFRKAWQEAQTGANRFKTPILENGMKLHELGVKPVDAQALEQRQASVTDIARMYRVPPHMIADLSRSTNNNISQQSLEFTIFTMLPWFVRWEQALSRDLLTDAEQEELFFEFNFEGLLRGDYAGRSSFYKELFGMGAISQNEIRAKENMNPIGKEGDRYFVPLNLVELKKANQPEQP